jgi:hypothetical protein
MEVDTEKVDEAVLALLYLGLHETARLEELRLGRYGETSSQGIHHEPHEQGEVRRVHGGRIEKVAENHAFLNPFITHRALVSEPAEREGRADGHEQHTHCFLRTRASLHALCRGGDLALERRVFARAQ